MASLVLSARLDAAVQRFKADFAANPNLVTNGQFQAQNAYLAEINRVVDAEFRAAAPVPAALQGAFEAWQDAVRLDKKVVAAIAAVSKVIKDNGLGARFPDTARVFGPDAKAATRAATAFSGVWTGGGVPAPVFATGATALAFVAARQREVSACHDTTVSLGRKLRSVRSAKGPTDKTLFSAGQIASASLASAGGNRQKVVFDPTQLAAAMKRIGDALDKGILYLVGTLSGENHTNVGKKFPDPEHWLLVFDRDGDAFVFWDSDLGTSDIGSFPT